MRMKLKRVYVDERDYDKVMAWARANYVTNYVGRYSFAGAIRRMLKGMMDGKKI